MKKIKLFEEFKDGCKCGGNCSCGTTTKQPIIETKSDGTISDDEDERMEDLLGTVEAEIDDLISKARDGAYDIGGNFRGPGNASQLKKLMLDKIKKMKH